MKYVGDQDFFTHYRTEEREHESVPIPISPMGVVTKHRFLHMFSGMRRQGDLEWYLTRMGAAAGLHVVVESMDLAYGERNDLDSQEVVDRLVQLGKQGFYSGAHNGAPCATWSRVRFRPGGPPPLRTRESPWGIASNTKAQQEYCDLHSRLWKNSMSVLEAVVQGNGHVSNEHPKDPGRDPYPSTWDLKQMKRIERLARMTRVTFPQCVWGQTARKLTCISSTLENIGAMDMFGDEKCYCRSHEMLVGVDEEGHFKTRKAQTYPPAMCEKMAELFIASWLKGEGNPVTLTREQAEESDEDELEKEPELGETREGGKQV